MEQESLVSPGVYEVHSKLYTPAYGPKPPCSPVVPLAPATLDPDLNHHAWYFRRVEEPGDAKLAPRKARDTRYHPRHLPSDPASKFELSGRNPGSEIRLCHPLNAPIDTRRLSAEASVRTPSSEARPSQPSQGAAWPDVIVAPTAILLFGHVPSAEAGHLGAFVLNNSISLSSGSPAAVHHHDRFPELISHSLMEATENSGSLDFSFSRLNVEPPVSTYFSNSETEVATVINWIRFTAALS